MGEKGNLLDIGEEIFADLAEQGPQFWLNYEQYKLGICGWQERPVGTTSGPTAYPRVVRMMLCLQ